MALAPVEQQLELAQRITTYTQAHLSPGEKNPVLTIRDVRKVSRDYWKILSLTDTVVLNTSEGYFKPQLQMRAAYMWARNSGIISYSDLVHLLKLPPGFLSCWIRRFACV